MDVSAVPIRSSFRTSDPGEAMEYISAHYATLRPRHTPTRFPFTSAATRTSDGLMRVAVVKNGTAMDALVEPDQPRTVTIVYPLRGRLAVSTRAEPELSWFDGPMLMPPHEPAWAAWNDVDVVTVQLDMSVLEAAAASLADRSGEPVHFTGTRPLTPHWGHHWKNLVRYISRDVLANPDAAASPLLIASAQHSLAAALLQTFPSNVMPSPDRTHRSAPAVPAAVRRAVAHIDDHPTSPLTLSDIAQAAGVPPRVLQRAFRRDLNTTPTQYLRRNRMEHAHRDLVAADPNEGATVNAIAARWGFNNQAGRFAAEYRASYGVPPSQTLRMHEGYRVSA